MNLLLFDRSQTDQPDDPSDWPAPGTRVYPLQRQLQHLREVLKVGSGASVQAGQLNGDIGRLEVEIMADPQQPEETVILRALAGSTPAPPPLPLTLLLALPRPKALRRIFQSLATMGVGRLILLNAGKVEKSYWQSPFLEEEAITAQWRLGLEQGCDTHLPPVVMEKRFKPFVEDRLPGLIAAHAHHWLALPNAPSQMLPVACTQPTLLAIGPEGGFTHYEIDKLTAAGLQPLRLGTRVLKSETAVIAAVARLFF